LPLSYSIEEDVEDGGLIHRITKLRNKQCTFKNDNRHFVRLSLASS